MLKRFSLILFTLLLGLALYSYPTTAPTKHPTISAQARDVMGFTIPWPEIEAYADRLIGPLAFPVWKGNANVRPVAGTPFFRDERLELALGYALPLTEERAKRLPRIVEGTDENLVALHFGWRWHQTRWWIPEWSSGTLTAKSRVSLVNQRINLDVVDSELRVTNPGWAGWPIAAVWPMVKGQVNHQLEQELTKSANEAAKPYLRWLPRQTEVDVAVTQQALSIETPTGTLPIPWLYIRSGNKR